MVFLNDKRTSKKVLKKWATCKRQDCKVNVTGSYREFFDCEVCEKHSDRPRTNRKRWYGSEY